MKFAVIGGVVIAFLLLFVGVLILFTATSQTNSVQPTATSQARQTAVTVQTNRELDELRALQTPGPLATRQQKDQYLAFITGLAVQSSTLDVTNCLPEPAILAVRNGSMITMTNQDTTDRRLEFNSKSYFVPAQSEGQYPITFSKGSGVYAYGCDDSDTPVGIMLVTK